MPDPHNPVPSHPEIDDLIANPEMEIPLADLPRIFQVTRLTFVCKRPPDVDTGIRLPSAVRGALGPQLAAVARDRADPPDRPTALQVIYGDHGILDRHSRVAKPYVIWCRAEGGRIFVEISLFGEAGLWRDDVIEAFARVMLPRARGGEGGISLDGVSRARRPWPIEDIYWRERQGYPVPKARNSFLMSFVTPLVLGNREMQRGEPWRMFSTLLIRLGGLARWHRADVPELRSFDEIEALCTTVRSEPVLPPKAAMYRRKSRSFGDMEKFETGILGSFLVRDYPRELWPAIVLGTLTNCGYDVPQGAGRYVISDP